MFTSIIPQVAHGERHDHAPAGDLGDLAREEIREAAVVDATAPLALRRLPPPRFVPLAPDEPRVAPRLCFPPVPEDPLAVPASSSFPSASTAAISFNQSYYASRDVTHRQSSTNPTLSSRRLSPLASSLSAACCLLFASFFFTVPTWAKPLKMDR